MKKDMSHQIDSIRESAREILAKPEIELALGEQANRLLAITNTLFIPTINNGVLHIPDEFLDTDTTAILPMRKDERLRLSDDFGNFTPKQRKNAKNIFEKMADPRMTIGAWVGDMETYLFCDPMSDVSLEGDVPGKTITQNYSYHRGHPHFGPQGLTVQVYGRPLIALNADLATNEATGAFIEQAKQAEYFLNNPIIRT